MPIPEAKTAYARAREASLISSKDSESDVCSKCGSVDCQRKACKLQDATMTADGVQMVGAPKKVAPALLQSFPDSIQMDVRGLFLGEVDGIFIFGDTGRGKSYLASAILRALLKDLIVEYETDAKFNAKWVRASRFLLEAQASWNDRTALSTMKVVKEYGTTGFLVLDDLGAERGTDTSRAFLTDLIEERQGNERPTVVTSNLTLQAIDDWEPRIASRLSTYLPIHMDGSDRRLG